MFSTLRKLLLLFLGIPFVILGTRFLLDAGSALLTFNSAEQWNQVSTTLVSVDNYSNADQALGNQTVVRYQYVFEGKSFEGQYSCIGDECPRPDLPLVLQSAVNEKKSITALVNPKRPDESLLYRHLYMPLLLLKSGVGLFCFLTGSIAVIFGVYLLRGPGASREKP